ncbi:MAG: hypothetical protein FWB72_06690 [Firmicutes bacterium]|nr:hypothetical protein [Bacillota bacterium]
MKNFWTFYKLQLRLLFKIDRSNTQSILLWIVLPITALILVGFFSFSVFGVGLVIRAEGYYEEVGYRFLSPIISFAMIAILVYSVGFMISRLYAGNDTQFVLSLPLSTTAIFLCRLFAIITLIFSLAVLGLTPILMAYGVGLGASALYYALIPLILVFAIFFPLAIAAIISLPLRFLINYIKGKNVLALVSVLLLTIGGIAAYIAFFVIIWGGGGVFDLGLGGEENGYAPNINLMDSIMPLIEQFERVLPFTTLFSNGLMDRGTLFLNITLVLAIVVALFVLLYTVGFLGYKSIIRGSLESDKKDSGGRALKYKQSSHFKALFVKEIRDMFRQPIFAFYCFYGILVMPALIVLITFMPTFDNTGSGGMFAFLAMVLFVSGANYVASATFTKDGKQFYLNCLVPVPFSLIIKTRLVYAAIFSSFGFVFGCITAVVVGFIPWYGAVFALAFFLLYNTGLSAISIALDLRYPRLNWNSLYEGLKNNPSTLWSMLIAGAFTIIAIVPAAILYFALSTLAMWLYLFALAITFLFVATYILFASHKNSLQRIEF